MRMVRLPLFILALLLLPVTSVFAQTGKISGVVTDAGTGETMPGVNVAIEGTTQGAVTDADGFYDIINVRPGTYSVRASFIGYAQVLIEDVRVNTGLTTEINFQLREETVGLQEVVVEATTPIVQLDVSANVASLTPEDFIDLPVAGVSEVLDLQAGIEPGLQVRGGGLNELAFVMDGMNLRTGRDQNPFTNISFTSVEEVQVQTGGFNAEYGNVRAGVINVTTKEPPRNRYTFDGLFRFTPAQNKSFNALGKLPETCDFSDPNNIDPNCNTYWVRPLFDPDVAMEGTDNGKWDVYMQRQFASSPDGLIGLAEGLQASGYDVAPEDMWDYYKYVFGKDNTVDIPDYQADFTVGGPLIPGISEKLGDLRFLFSYRGVQTAYSLPQSRDSYDANTIQGKVTSNIRPGMKLTVHGMHGTERGIVPHGDNPRVTLWQGNMPSYPWQGLSGGAGFGVAPVVGISAERADVVYSDGFMSLGDIDHTMFGMTFTHTLNSRTFYEVNLQNVASKYRSHFANLREGSFVCPSSGVGPNNESCTPGTVVGVGYAVDGVAVDERAFCFGGGSDVNGDGEVKPYCPSLRELPMGYSGGGGNLIGSGVSTGGHWNKTRDTSDVNIFTGRFDITSQVNRFLQIKTGAELILSNYDINSERVSQELGFVYEQQEWNRTPIQGAAYAQSKLEFQGMIANVGVRLDYFNPNSEWWVFEPYDAALRGQQDRLDEQLQKEDPDAKVYVSPRIGVSFPITQNSKLYFNYGHFRQMLSPFSIFGVQSTPAGGIDVIGNPTHPMPQTVAYELGFDQNLFNQYLLRVSGFYRDVRQQPRDVVFHSLGDVVNYTTRYPWNYEDIRGAEFTLSKNRGEWFRGFVNYTFLQTKSGNFGFAEFFENDFDQQTYLLTSTDYRQFAPVAQPFARLNLMLLTPGDFGPDVAGLNPLSDWVVSFLGEWRSGEKWTWRGPGGGFPELQNNISWRDFWNFDLRFTKHIRTGGLADLQVFLDIDNVFNRKHLYNQAAFGSVDGRDFELYMTSLHLPEDTFDDINAMTCADEGVKVKDCDFSKKQGLPYVWIPGDDKPGLFRAEGVDFQPIEARASLPNAPESGTERAWYWAQNTGEYSRWNGQAWEPVPDDEVQKVLDDKAYIDMPNYQFNTFLNPRRYTIGLRLTF